MAFHGTRIMDKHGLDWMTLQVNWRHYALHCMKWRGIRYEKG
jgi:hypothetical protein